MKKMSRFHSDTLTPGERKRSRPNWIALAAVVCLVAMGTPASPVSPLRVGTSGDYALSVCLRKTRRPGLYQGLAPTLARAFARDRGLDIEFVLFRWPDLLEDLDAGLFDVAMSGVTVRPERSLRGRFSIPLTTSGALVLVPDASPFVTIEDSTRSSSKSPSMGGGIWNASPRSTSRKPASYPCQKTRRSSRHWPRAVWMPPSRHPGSPRYGQANSPDCAASDLLPVTRKALPGPSRQSRTRTRSRCLVARSRAERPA